MQEFEEKKGFSIIPFQLQKPQKKDCEDAPPIATDTYSIVCDGVGGSGSTEHISGDETSSIDNTHTSAFLGSRIVSACVNLYYQDNITGEFILSDPLLRKELTQNFVNNLKTQLRTELQQKTQNYPCKSFVSANTPIFPTTLASTIYMLQNNRVMLLAIWSGDSRIYIVTPSKGLQQLSRDDAVNAGKEMYSDSAMTNCIAANQDFYLNFAWAEINEPCIVFCCTDGCFDALLSPLHLEMHILRAIMDEMPDSMEPLNSQLIAEKLSIWVCKDICDDTTMSGAIFGVQTYQELKGCFLDRARKLAAMLQDINPSFSELDSAEIDRSNAKRTCALLKPQIIDHIILACRKTMQTNNNVSLSRQLSKLKCYQEFASQIEQLDESRRNDANKECISLENQKKELLASCREMFLIDYMYANNLFQSTKHDILLPFRKFTNKQETSADTDMHLYFAQCIELLIRMFSLPKAEKYLRACMPNSQQNHLKIELYQQFLLSIQQLLNSNQPYLTELLVHSFYSAPCYKKIKKSVSKSIQFKQLFYEMMKKSKYPSFVSVLTHELTEEYRNFDVRFEIVKKKYDNRFTKEKEAKINEFLDTYQADIIESITSLRKKQVQVLFGDSFLLELMIKYHEAQEVLKTIDDKIQQAENNINRIWEQYKVDYQLFEYIEEKGTSK